MDYDDELTSGNDPEETNPNEEIADDLFKGIDDTEDDSFNEY